MAIGASRLTSNMDSICHSLRWRDDLDHQPVAEPEFDDVKERLLPLHAAAEDLGAPAFARPDALDLVRLQRHREQHMEGPGTGRRLVLAEHDLTVAGRNVESRALRIDLDHRAVRVATRRHEGAFEWPERMALAAHQFGQDLSDMARLAGRNRYVVDHCASPISVR